MMKTRTFLDQTHAELIDSLTIYEDTGIKFYTEDDLSKRTLTNPENEDIKEKITEESKKIKNPYEEAHIWLKGEFLDIQGMNDCLIGRENVMKAQIATENKKKSDQKELEKLSQGKKTLKSVFKSKSSKESTILSLQAALEIEDQEIEDFKKVVNFLTIYHG